MSCEDWRTVEEAPAYEVSCCGQVRRAGRILKPWIDNGYERVGLWQEGEKKNQYVHALVCVAFHGPRENRLVDHIDGHMRRNTKDNLRWVTDAENVVNTDALKGRYKGVMPRERKDGVVFVAQAKLEGKTKHLGTFPTDEAAAMAYDRFVMEHYPPTARLNLLCRHCGSMCFPWEYPLCGRWDLPPHQR